MHLEIETLGDFFGTHKTPRMLERLMFEFFQERKHFEPEPGLMAMKWFDYRFMHPVLATYYYAQCYRRVYKRKWERHVDRRTSVYAAGIKADDLFKADNATIRACWTGRQTADYFGMPYELYIELAMERAMGWKRDFLPRPQQLYSEQLTNAAHAGWVERQASRLFVAADPRYRLGAWRGDGTAHQRAHEAWVCDQLAKRTPGSRAILLGTYLWRDPVVRERFALERFGADTLTLARAEMPN